MVEKRKNIIAIHQPNYIPWLGYFFKIHQADVFVFFDDAQYSNTGMHNYHYIKTVQGPFRLKIPVIQKLGDRINQVRIRDELRWQVKHLKTIETFYHKAPFFDEVFNDFRSILGFHYENLAEMNSRIIRFFSGKLGISTLFLNSSDLNVDSSREQKIIDICILLNSSIYYSGTGAKAYQYEEDFVSSGLELRYSVFKPFIYPQLFSGFQSNVTILDYLMNCGYDWNRVIESQKLN
jgi:hypothetical protein